MYSPCCLTGVPFLTWPATLDASSWILLLPYSFHEWPHSSQWREGYQIRRRLSAFSQEVPSYPDIRWEYKWWLVLFSHYPCIFSGASCRYWSGEYCTHILPAMLTSQSLNTGAASHSIMERSLACFNSSAKEDSNWNWKCFCTLGYLIGIKYYLRKHYITFETFNLSIIPILQRFEELNGSTTMKINSIITKLRNNYGNLIIIVYHYHTWNTV